MMVITGFEKDSLSKMSCMAGSTQCITYGGKLLFFYPRTRFLHSPK